MSPKTESTLSQEPFPLIHELHQIVADAIDTGLTWDQINAPEINYNLIRPIIRRMDYRKGRDRLNPPNASKDPSIGVILFAIMANRLQFISLANDLSYAPIQNARAAFCELLAIIRKLSRPDMEAELASELVREFCAFTGAPSDVWSSIGSDRDEVEETSNSALELAIITSSKHFLSLPIVQHVIHGIYTGALVYSPTSNKSLITDSYISERRRRNSNTSCEQVNLPVYAYNPYEAGWLDHGRLRVPKYRKWQDFASQAILLSLFVATLSFKNLDRIAGIEIVFIIFTAGFMLDEYATSQEHGWTVYAANTWNVFDLSYIFVFLLYFILRIVGLATKEATSELAFDILSCGSCILFPRLVFFLIKDNVVILALKAMISRFVRFMGLVIVAFSGICFCLWTLGRGTWTVRQITWLMLQIWVGANGVSRLILVWLIVSSESFHPIFGPIILISYAALCNTLLITILISILSNEFAEINANAQEEHLFQRVVKTVEGVKSDAIFCYFPPVNLIALVVLGPLSWMLTPRQLHRVNVFAIRATSFPVLLAISAWERKKYRSKQIRLDQSYNGFGFLGPETLIPSVFEMAPKDDSQTPLSGAFKESSQSNIGKEMADLRQSQERIEEMLAKLVK